MFESGRFQMTLVKCQTNGLNGPFPLYLNGDFGDFGHK